MIKRKLIPSLLMIMICAGMILLVKGVQEKAAAVPQAAAQAAAQRSTASETKQEASAASAASSTANRNEKSSENAVNTAGSSANTGTKSASGTSSSSGASTTAVNSAAPAEAENKAEVSFAVYDTVSGKYLKSTTVAVSDGDTAAGVTMKALDGDYRASGSGESIYFSKMMGIAEKSAGPLSGWCYYVNGQKPGISAGSYKLKAGDSLEWKFLKDGTNN